MTRAVADKIRRDARSAYADLRDEEQSESDAEFSASENVYDEYVDKGYAPHEVQLALTTFRDRESDELILNRFP